MADELLEWRREFPILESAVYLISHSLGAMPRRTYERLQDYADVWATRGVRAWAEGWWEMPQTVGDEVARIIGAEPGTVVMHQNVSVCQSLILSCFDTTPETRRVMTRAPSPGARMKSARSSCSTPISRPAPSL